VVVDKVVEHEVEQVKNKKNVAAFTVSWRSFIKISIDQHSSNVFALHLYGNSSYDTHGETTNGNNLQSINPVIH
jgi:hypothetical protein